LSPKQVKKGGQNAGTVKCGRRKGVEPGGKAVRSSNARDESSIK